MLSFIKQVDDSTKWQVACFGGAVIIEGRMLSPIESEAAGISSSMIAASMMDPKQLSKVMKNREKFQNINLEDPTDQDMETLLNFMDGFRPEQLLGVEEQQNKIIIQVVKRASEDGGKTFQRLQLVAGYDQQNPEQNLLWVGMLTKEDRQAILNKAMSAHVEAVESLRNFCKTG